MEGILYSSWGRKFRKYYGSIDQPASGYLTNFFVYDPEPGSKVRFVVNKTPGKIYNKQVWFEKENDKLALKILMDHEISEIEELCKKILQHKELHDELKRALTRLEKAEEQE